MLKKTLTDFNLSGMTLVHRCEDQFDEIANSVLLLSAFHLLVLEQTPEEAFSSFQNLEILPFRDAIDGEC
jgi:hypothetical protein